MRKTYTAPATRHISIVFGAPLLEVAIGSIHVNSYKAGNRTEVGGDTPTPSTSRSTIWDDDTDIDEE